MYIYVSGIKLSDVKANMHYLVICFINHILYISKKNEHFMRNGRNNLLVCHKKVSNVERYFDSKT